MTAWGVFLLVLAASLAAGYAIPTGRQRTLGLVILIAALIILWRLLKPLDALALMALLVWSGAQLPGGLEFVAGPLLRGMTLLEAAVYLGVVVLVVRELAGRGVSAAPLVLPRYWAWLAAFALFGVLAFLFGHTPDRGFAWQMLRQAVFMPLAVYVLVANVVRSESDGARVLNALIVGAVLLAIVKFLGIGQEANPSQVLSERLSGAYDLGLLGTVLVGLNTGAQFFGVAATLVGVETANARTTTQRALAAAGFGVLGAVVLLMGTRAVWAAMIVGLAIAVTPILRRYPGSRPRRVLRIGAVAVAVVAGAIALGFLNETLTWRLTTLRSPSVLFAEEEWLTRLAIWQTGLGLLSKNLLGSGYIEFVLPRYSAHSEYLALALAAGVPGLACAVTFVGLCLRRVVRAARQQAEGGWVLPAVVATTVMFAVSAVAIDGSKRFFPYVAFWLALSVGMTVAESVHGHGEPSGPIER